MAVLFFTFGGAGYKTVCFLYFTVIMIWTYVYIAAGFLTDRSYICLTSCSKIFHLHGDVTTASEEMQKLGLYLAFLAFKQGRIYIYITTSAVTQRADFSVLS